MQRAESLRLRSSGVEVRKRAPLSVARLLRRGWRLLCFVARYRLLGVLVPDRQLLVYAREEHPQEVAVAQVLVRVPQVPPDGEQDPLQVESGRVLANLVRAEGKRVLLDHGFRRPRD